MVLTDSDVAQDCTCLAGCRYCAIELRLDVVCNDNRTMEVTSNHLDVVEFSSNAGPSEVITEGEELPKRGEAFGYPVGKSASLKLSQWSFSLSHPARRSDSTSSFNL